MTLLEELYTKISTIQTYELEEFKEENKAKQVGLIFAYTSLIMDSICECKLTNNLFEIRTNIENLINSEDDVMIILGRISAVNDYISRLKLELELNSVDFMDIQVELLGNQLRIYTNNIDNLDEIIKVIDKIILNIYLYSKYGKNNLVDLDTHINNLFLYPGIYTKGTQIYCVSIPVIDANYGECYSYKYFDLTEEELSNRYNLRTGIPDIGKDVKLIGTTRNFKIDDVITISKNAVIALNKLGEIKLSDKYKLRKLDDRQVELVITLQPSNQKLNVILGDYEESCRDKILIGKIIGNNLMFKYGRGKRFKYINLIRVY